MTRPLRLGFLGAGLIATYHSKSLRRSGIEIEPAGVFDPDDDRARAFSAASGHPVRRSEQEVIDASDAVYVCTWTSEHPRQVAAVASAGKHLFCEKPLAVDLATAESMATDVDRAGITHQVGLVLRRSPAYLWARHLINDPASGGVMSVVFRDDQFIPIQGHYSSTWRADRRLAGAGTLLEHSIHDVDMLAFLVGEIDAVSAHTAFVHELDGIEDVAAATLSFRSGALGTLTSVWHDNLARPSLRRVEVFCRRRHIVIDGDDWFGPVQWTDTDGGGGALEGHPLQDAARQVRDSPENPDEAFLTAVLRGERATPDLHTALAAHRVVDAMYRSAAAGGTSITLAP
jgi:predicted dehydrogenase